MDYLRTVEKVYDNLHGFVELNKAEKEIIGSMYFQRLRDIKQLGFAYYVFPGAVHTRYSHSLGVLWVMNEILTELSKKYSDSAIKPRDIRNLRMAALLHDIGHYPFSHLIESVYKEVGAGLREKELEEDFSKNETGESREYSYLKRNNTGIEHHEKLGEYIIKNTNFDGGITKILKDNGFSDDDIDDIAKSILGTCRITWYNQLMHSDLDVDRCDYLLRDAHATGLYYGHFDLQYLIKHIQIVEDRDNPNSSFITVSPSAVFTLEHYLLARYFWYAQIINDRTILVFNEIAKEIYKHLVEEGLVYSFEEIKKNVLSPCTFIEFNDNYFWNSIYKAKEDPKIKKYVEMLIKRRPLKSVEIPFAKELMLKDFKNRQSNLTEIEKKVDILCKDIEDFLKTKVNNPVVIKTNNYVDIVAAYEEICTEDGNNIFESDKEPIRIAEPNEKGFKYLVQQRHSITKCLSNLELIIPRIYVEEEYKNDVNEFIDKQYSSTLLKAAT